MVRSTWCLTGLTAVCAAFFLFGANSLAGPNNGAGNCTCIYVCSTGVCSLQCDAGCGPGGRVEAAQKGSILVWPKIELRWTAEGAFFQDTFIELSNDYPGLVDVHLYFVNGDPETAPIFNQGQLVERGHPGWNNANCTLRLTQDQPTYWSARTGLPGGCQPFTSLDSGFPPGRVDLERYPTRVLRGFIVGFAVDRVTGNPISWNHLSGGALLVNYGANEAWEYNAYAFQALYPQGEQIPGAIADKQLGRILHLDGISYQLAYDQLLLEYYAAGTFALSGGDQVVQLDGDLTLMPVTQDLRQDTCGPVRTKANFVIHNQNEVGFSGTERCISCWNQTLFSRYARNANYLLRYNVQTDKAKARIDGVGSNVCDLDEDCEFRISVGNTAEGNLICWWYPECAVYTPLLGVQSKIMAFSTPSQGVLGYGLSGSALVGQGWERGAILYDVPQGPQPVVVPAVGDDGAEDSVPTAAPVGTVRTTASDSTE